MLPLLRRVRWRPLHLQLRYSIDHRAWTKRAGPLITALTRRTDTDASALERLAPHLPTSAALTTELGHRQARVH
jgi:hypothetical protein